MSRNFRNELQFLRQLSFKINLLERREKNRQQILRFAFEKTLEELAKEESSVRRDVEFDELLELTPIYEIRSVNITKRSKALHTLVDELQKKHQQEHKGAHKSPQNDGIKSRELQAKISMADQAAAHMMRSRHKKSCVKKPPIPLFGHGLFYRKKESLPHRPETACKLSSLGICSIK